MSTQVFKYTKGTVVIYFPDAEIRCHLCPLLNTERVGNTYRCFCKRTGEFIPSPLDMIGRNCPIQFEEDENGEIQAFDS